MNDKKFDPKKLDKLNNPERLKDIPVDFVLDKLNIRQKSIFVEIGAGTAFFSIAFLKHAEPSKIYACDVSEAMINWVQENIVPKFPNIIPQKTEEHSIPLETEIADLVFMINLHHELDKPIKTIQEAHRLLKWNGSIVVIDWKKKEMSEGPPIHIRCSPEDVLEQLGESGFLNARFFDDLPKHFMLVGEKKRQNV